MAKAMHLPVSEMQQPYRLFRQHVNLSDGEHLLKDGRLTEKQFAKLVRDNFSGGHAGGGSFVEAERSINRAFVDADTHKNGALSFEDFATWIVSHGFDEGFNIDAEERELRTLAKQYKLTLVEVDKYKKMFDEIDVDHSGKIENSGFDDVLLRCGNIPRDIGLSASRRQQLWRAADPERRGGIDFEDFMVFNLKYFAKGSRGVSDIYNPRPLPASPLLAR